MSIVPVIYLSALFLALVSLYLFRARKWYWHAAAIALALFLGLVPPPAGWAGRPFDVTVGFAFFFLLLWGIAAPFFRKMHHHL